MFNDAWLTAVATHGASLVTHGQAHSGDPGAAGTANVLSVARVTATKSVDADGDITITLAFTGLAAGTAVPWVSYWSAAGTGTPPTGGTWYGNAQRTTGDATANAAGTITVTCVETGTAT